MTSTSFKVVCAFLVAISSVGLASSKLGRSVSLLDIQLLRAQQITSFFENSKTSFQYDYIRNLNDGRGLTAGRVGFCSGTGDLVRVVRVLCKNNPAAQSCAELPRLEEINKIFLKTADNVEDVSGLENLPSNWVADSQTMAMKSAQDYVVNKLYLFPALALAKRVGLRTALGFAIFYDTLVQHGSNSDEGDTGDSVDALIQRTLKQMSFDPSREVEWLNLFLDVRRADLLNPFDRDSQKVWSESVTRVDTFRRLFNIDQNLDLSRPVTFAPGVVTD